MVDVALDGDRSAHTLLDQSGHFDLMVDLVDVRVDLVTQDHLRGGLRRPAIHPHMPRFADPRRLTAGGTQADRPQPLINARVLHHSSVTDRRPVPRSNRPRVLNPPDRFNLVLGRFDEPTGDLGNMPFDNDAQLECVRFATGKDPSHRQICGHGSAVETDQFHRPVRIGPGPSQGTQSMTVGRLSGPPLEESRTTNVVQHPGRLNRSRRHCQGQFWIQVRPCVAVGKSQRCRCESVPTGVGNTPDTHRVTRRDLIYRFCKLDQPGVERCPGTTAADISLTVGTYEHLDRCSLSVGRQKLELVELADCVIIGVEQCATETQNPIRWHLPLPTNEVRPGSPGPGTVRLFKGKHLDGTPTARGRNQALGAPPSAIGPDNRRRRCFTKIRKRLVAGDVAFPWQRHLDA